MSDYAGIISSEARARLEDQLRRFEEETSNQIVVVTFPSLEGESLEDFSIRLAEQWKIGQKDKANGVILLIFKDDRKVRIEVGYGLEGVLPDATAKLIIENEITPRFREGKFDEGIESAADAIMQATKGEYQAERSTNLEKALLIQAIFVGFLLGLVLGLLPIQILLFGGMALSFLSGALGWRLLALLGFVPGWTAFLVYHFIGRALQGSATLTRDGYRRSSGGFGGGFSSGGFGGGGFSGGGGSFGGGGASGGW